MYPFNVISKADVFKMFFNMGECNINIPLRKKEMKAIYTGRCQLDQTLNGLCIYTGY